jgi:hypothetical protein
MEKPYCLPDKKSPAGVTILPETGITAAVLLFILFLWLLYFLLARN